MSDTRTPEFSDGQIKAQENPSQSQGDSPRNVETDTDQAEFAKWKAQRNQTPGMDVKSDEPVIEQYSAKQNYVSTGRSTAPTEVTKSEAPERKDVKQEKPQSYVWLANGEVVRANDEDLPGAAGAGNAFGHWQKDGKVYLIVNVYPVEENAEK